MGDGAGKALSRRAEFGAFDVLSERAHELYLQGASLEAVRSCRESLAVVEAAGDAVTARYLRYTAGVSLLEAGLPREAVAEAQRLLSGVDAAAEPFWRAKGLALLAEASVAVGDVTRALDALAEGTHLLAEPSQAYNHMSASMAVAIALLSLNLFEQADGLLMASVRRDDPTLQMLTLQEAALLRLRWGTTLELLGEHVEARQHYVVAASRALCMHRNAVQLRHPVLAGMALVYQAFVWERLGEPDLAERMTRAAVDTHPYREDKTEAHLASIVLGRVLASRGAFAEARHHLEDAAERATLAGREIWAATAVAALAEADEAELGAHPGITRWRDLARDLMLRIWEDRHSRYSALRSRIKVLELLERSDRMEQEALEDPLTGLGNRRRLVEHVAALDGVLSVLFIDVDRFKSVNDDFSHDVGDAVLVSVADLLTNHCRAEDCVVRYGGDEFLVIVAGDPAAAEILAERVLVAVRTTEWGVVAPGLSVTVSVGLSSGLTLAQVLKQADSALYQAKRAGRDQLVTF